MEEDYINRCALHHLEMRVNNGQEIVEEFVIKYGFKVIGERSSASFHQWYLGVNRCNFLVTEILPVANAESEELVNDPFITGWTGNNGLTVNCGKCDISTVCNVVLQVDNLENYLNKLTNSGVTVVKPVRKICNQNGEMLIATVQSCLENIEHSLIQRNNYKGELLPGFSEPYPHNVSINKIRSPSVDITHIDHVTFVCQTGRSPSVVSWYERCFGMKNFSLNKEDPDGSLVVKGPNVGLRLSAFDYWKCSETGLTMPGKEKITFVIAEPFGRSGHSHVKTFMKHHNGPGIQHVGLHSCNIIHTIKTLKECGIDFVEPPYTYYEEEYFVQKVEELGGSLQEDIDSIKKLGILLDSEDQPADNEFPQKYLMQVFTKPIFNEDTFFLEIIQRRGAAGFGSGNITALCRAVEKLKSTQVAG